MLQRQGKKQGRSPRSKLGQSYHGPAVPKSVYHTADIRYSALWVQLFSDMRGRHNPLTLSGAGASPARIEGRTQDLSYL